MSAPGIGSTLYCFDINARTYERDDRTGRAYGAPIYEKHFVAHLIAAETKPSWIMDTGCKVNKRTMLSAAERRGYSGFQWYTEETKAEAVWIAKNRYRIESMIRGADIVKLRAIAEILGVRDDAR